MGKFNSTYRRMHILSGNKNEMWCEVCGCEIKTSGHYRHNHPDLYEIAKCKRNL